MRVHSGWYQVATLSEVDSDVTSVGIADRRYLLVRRPDGLSLLDGTCPHRGADLARATLCGDHLVCAFHGRAVGLDRDSALELCVDSYETRVVGPLVFARLGDGPGHGFGERLDAIESGRFILDGFRLHIAADPELVIENAFDDSHFVAVHGVNESPGLVLVDDDAGALAVEGSFRTNVAVPWQHGSGSTGGPLADRDVHAVQTAFKATAYSPTVVISELIHEAGADVVITAAVPDAEGGCIVRVSVGVGLEDGAVPFERAESLIADSRQAFDQDIPIWETVRNGVVGFGPGDETAAAFQQFAATFRSLAADP